MAHHCNISHNNTPIRLLDGRRLQGGAVGALQDYPECFSLSARACREPKDHCPHPERSCPIRITSDNNLTSRERSARRKDQTPFSTGRFVTGAARKTQLMWESSLVPAAWFLAGTLATVAILFRVTVVMLGY